MKKWSCITLLIIVLSLLPMSLMEWNTNAATSQFKQATEEAISNDAQANAAADENAHPVNGGYMPKAGRSYTYKPSFEDSSQKTYHASANPSLDNSVELLEDDYIGYTYIEGEQELSLGVAYSDVFFFNLSYPLKENTTIADTDYLMDGSTKTTPVFVDSTSAAITTKAGTFSDVVILTYPNGSKLYLAKDYGIIRITDFEGTITTELVGVN